HVGTEAALLAGQPLVNADETAPLRPDSPALYASTKARAEQAVRGANVNGVFETVVVRPRFVWGVGDTSVLPSLVEAVERGRFSRVHDRHLQGALGARLRAGDVDPRGPRGAAAVGRGLRAGLTPRPAAAGDQPAASSGPTCHRSSSSWDWASQRCASARPSSISDAANSGAKNM